jgi:signal transduction histidine kinase
MSTNLSDSQNLIEQALDRQPLIVSPDTGLSEAIAIMNANRSSYVLIAQEQELLGILTERDVVRLTVSETCFDDLTISAVMSQNVISCQCDRLQIFSILDLLRTSRIRHLPITDAAGKLLGIITPERLRSILQPTDLLKVRYVDDIMVAQVITANTDTSVFQVAQLMVTHRKSCVVICESITLDAESKLKPVGIITERDIVKFKVAGLDLVQTPAATVMSCPLKPVSLNASMWQAHKMMQEYSTRRLVVTDAAGYLAGIVTQSNLLQILDPAEMYTTVEILQRTVSSQTQELQQEVWRRHQIEEKLRQTNETLEAQVQERTAELSIANKQLAQKNQELSQAIAHLQATQIELIQSEKMAALGQLLAGVTHEINTPLAAIRSSVKSIASFLTNDLENFSTFVRQLSPEQYADFWKLLHQSKLPSSLVLSTKEKRQLKKAIRQQISAWDIGNVETVVDILNDLGLGGQLESFSNLFQAKKCQDILEKSHQIYNLISSTNTIDLATETAVTIVLAMKKYARYDQLDRKILTQIPEGIKTVLLLYHHSLKQGVELRENYADSLPEILGYPDELNQVWTNLIQNALQAMENKGCLKIDVTQAEKNIQVKITDSGKGIPPEVMPKIFQSFFTTKPPGEGSGLGLDIVKKIIEKHDGKIEVESQPGETTFTVLIPIAT